MKKIVHICFSDRVGGAAIAAYRLNEEMNKINIHSSMLVLNKTQNQNPTIHKLSTQAKLLNKIYQRITKRKLNKKIRFGTFSCDDWGFDITKISLIEQADLIYFHWFNHEFIQLKTINKLTRKMNKKVILFLHDMWAMTGGCHYSLECKSYLDQCQYCPLLYHNGKNDLSSQVFKRKIKYIKNNENISIITPSNWLSDCSRKSFILKDLKITTIHNVLNHEIFKLLDKSCCRYIYTI